MPEYLAPGVSIEELKTGPRSIEGVTTSTAGFVGQSERGPTCPRLVTSWRGFRLLFGDLVDPSVSYLPYAARGFFDNGGQKLFVARVVRDDADTSSLTHASSIPGQYLNISAIGPGAFGNGVFVRIQAGTRTGIRLTILYYRTVPIRFVDPTDATTFDDSDRRELDAIEDYDNLGVQPTDPNYFLPYINASSHLVFLAWLTVDARSAA